MHNDDYYRRANDKLRKASTRDEAVAILQDIQASLKKRASSRVDSPMTSRESRITPRAIRSPGDLADVIRRVAEAVRTGDLLAFAPAEPPLLGREIDIRKLDPDGPWPDHLELHSSLALRI